MHNIEVRTVTRTQVTWVQYYAPRTPLRAHALPVSSTYGAHDMCVIHLHQCTRSVRGQEKRVEVVVSGAVAERGTVEGQKAGTFEGNGDGRSHCARLASVPCAERLTAGEYAPC